MTFCSRLLAGVLLATPLLASSAATLSAAELTVNVSGVTAGKGNLNLSLHTAAKDFADDDGTLASEAFNRAVKVTVPADSGDVTIKVDVPAGNYSVSVYQDMNSDGEFETNFFGVPQEPYGFSNNARGTFGKPSFDDVLIMVAEETAIDIHVK